MISKELLSVVLGEDIYPPEKTGQNILSYYTRIKDDITYTEGEYKSINIHELAFLIRDYLDEKYSIYLSLDRSLKSFFTEANRVYEEL